MKVKKKGYVPLLALTIIFTLAAISTLFPQATASKLCGLGYPAHCSFAPWSTLLCLLLACATCIVRAEFFKTEQPKND